MCPWLPPVVMLMPIMLVTGMLSKPEWPKQNVAMLEGHLRDLPVQLGSEDPVLWLPQHGFFLAWLARQPRLDGVRH